MLRFTTEKSLHCTRYHDTDTRELLAMHSQEGLQLSSTLSLDLLRHFLTYTKCRIHTVNGVILLLSLTERATHSSIGRLIEKLL